MIAEHLQRLHTLFGLNRAHVIARRYFVVNGFDGALTMLGLLIGFLISATADLNTALTACMGATIALGTSGFSSAYMSEAAERQREFRQLQHSMMSDLKDSAHAQASRWTPWLIAIVNGASPLLIGVLIMLPLWLASIGYAIPLGPFGASITVAFCLIFLLGAFLGDVSGSSWLVSGLKALAIGLITALFIYTVT